MSNIIDIKNATIKKGECTLLDSLTLTIKTGEHTAIIGPNGAGKSSLLKLVTREYYPVFNPETSVSLFDESHWDLFELRKKIGIISPNFDVVYQTHLTGYELVLSGYFGSKGIFSHQHVTDDMVQKTNDIIDFLEINSLKYKPLKKMSSGEVNRFYVARALINEPKALILDEPTANLDMKATRIFLSYISMIAREGTTIIMVTHHLHDIIEDIQHIILLKNGSIYKTGSKTECLTSEHISGLFDFKIQVTGNNGHYFTHF